MARQQVQESDAPEPPRKAYLVKWTVGNEMEALVYAHSAQDALRRLDAGEGTIENTYDDRRVTKPRAKRWPREDLDAES